MGLFTTLRSSQTPQTHLCHVAALLAAVALVAVSSSGGEGLPPLYLNLKGGKTDGWVRK